MENFEQEVVVKQSHDYRNLFVSLAIVFAAVCILYFLLARQERPESKNNVISETPQAIYEKSTETDEIFSKLAASDYSVDIRQNDPCGDGPCDRIRIEEGLFAIENKQNGFELNLSTTILKDLITADFEIRDVVKIGQDIVFYFYPSKSLYKIDVAKKEIVAFYTSDTLYPVHMTYKKGRILTGWQSASDNESTKGVLVVVDPTISPYRIVEYPFDVEVNPNLILLSPVSAVVVPRNYDGDTVWVLSQYEPHDVCMNGADCKAIHTIIDLKTGKVIHQKTREILWEDQPEYLENNSHWY